MDTYWLTTDGCLYFIDDSNTYTLEPSGDTPVGTGSLSLPLYHAELTGQRGRLTPYRKTGVIRFTASSEGQILEAVTFFRDGRLDAVLCKGPIFSCDMVQR